MFEKRWYRTNKPLRINSYTNGINAKQNLVILQGKTVGRLVIFNTVKKKLGTGGIGVFKISSKNNFTTPFTMLISSNTNIHWVMT